MKRKDDMYKDFLSHGERIKGEYEKWIASQHRKGRWWKVVSFLIYLLAVIIIAFNIYLYFFF